MVGAAAFRGAEAFGGAEVFRGALRAGGSTSRSRGVNMREKSPMVPTVRRGPATAALRRARDGYVRVRWVRSRLSVSPRKNAGDLMFQTIISSTPNIRLATPMMKTTPMPASEAPELFSGWAMR